MVCISLRNLSVDVLIMINKYSDKDKKKVYEDQIFDIEFKLNFPVKAPTEQMYFPINGEIQWHTTSTVR